MQKLYEIVQLNLTGNAATIYSILEKGESKTLFGKFIAEYTSSYKKEVDDIMKRLRIMGIEMGAKPDFFKPYEGNFGDKVCILFDLPQKKLRLYCIRLSDKILILGGGGSKPAGMTAYENDATLDASATWMKEVSKDLRDYRYERKIKLSERQDKLIGKLKNYDNE